MIACRRKGAQDAEAVHPLISGALSSRSLMLLGYSLREWDFRSLFWGLIQARSNTAHHATIAQLEPSPEEKNYLKLYFREPDFRFFWGRADAFVKLVYDDSWSKGDE